jgi:hypothetical protein
MSNKNPASTHTRITAALQEPREKEQKDARRAKRREQHKTD